MPVSWQGANTTTTAFRGVEECKKRGVEAMFFDSVGVGAGVKGTLASAAHEKVAWFPINVGAEPTDTYWQDQQRTSKEMFVNLRAELWGLLRARFEKTYEFVVEGIKHKPEDMISIPNCQELIVELSLPKRLYTETGKIGLESKKAMKARGVKSPDHADSLALAFMPMTTKFEIGTPEKRAQNSDGYNSPRRGTLGKAPRGVFHNR
jgi:phage terminase large subunit